MHSRAFRGQSTPARSASPWTRDRLSARARLSDPPRERLESLRAALETNPAFHRLMTWLVLEGHDVAQVMCRHPVVGDIAAEAEATGAPDPALEAGMPAFCGISFQGYGGLVNRAMGREAGDERLRAAVADMYASWASVDRSEDETKVGDIKPSP